MQALRAKAQHFYQAWLIEHGVGIGRANQSGYASGNGGGQFRSQHAFVLMARLAQAGGQVYQAGHNDAALGVQGLASHKIGRYLAQGQHASVGNRYIALRIQATGGIEQVAIANH